MCESTGRVSVSDRSVNFVLWVCSLAEAVARWQRWPSVGAGGGAGGGARCGAWGGAGGGACLHPPCRTNRNMSEHVAFVAMCLQSTHLSLSTSAFASD